MQAFFPEISFLFLPSSMLYLLFLKPSTTHTIPMLSIKDFKLLKQKKQNKLHNTPTTINSIRFHSKLEAKYYQYLLLLKSQNLISFFLMQVPFHLPGNTKYLLDFLIVHNDNSISYIDTKGLDTPISILKRKLVQSLYPVYIEIIKHVP